MLFEGFLILFRKSTTIGLLYMHKVKNTLFVTNLCRHVQEARLELMTPFWQFRFRFHTRIQKLKIDLWARFLMNVNCGTPNVSLFSEYTMPVRSLHTVYWNIFHDLWNLLIKNNVCLLMSFFAKIRLFAVLWLSF